MKITDVRVLLHRRQVRPGSLDPIPALCEFCVLTIDTDEGVSGHAFVGGPGPGPRVYRELLLTVVRPLLLGKDPGQIGVIWHQLWRQRSSLGLTVIGGVDVALWDLLGVAAGLPIHRLLGTARTTIPGYISSWVHRRPEDYAAEARHYRDLGYTGYKLHPPTQRRKGGENVPLDEDIAAAQLVREAVGPQMRLMSDSPGVYSYNEALQMGRVLQDLDYFWYEDPLPTDDIHGYTRLREHLHIPLLATEMTDGGPFGFAPWIMSRATDYLRGDVAFKGGITALMKIAHTAEVFGLSFEVHDGFNALNNVAGLHVAMALPDTQFFELLTPQPTGVYGLAETSYGVKAPFRVDGSGNLAAPDRPGLGVELDWDLLRAGEVNE